MALVLGAMKTELHEEHGSALVTTLIILTVLSTLLGTVLIVFVAQYRFIRRDTHRTQAQYVAEAGVSEALARLQHNPMWRPVDTLLTLSFDRSATVRVEAFGGYLLVRSKAQQGHSQATVRALVGEEIPARADNAIVLWDTESSLNVAGKARVKGDIIVGERGVTESAFKSEPFTGEVDGTVYPIPELEAPFFEASVFEETLQQASFYLQAPRVPREREGAYEHRTLANVLPSGNPVHFTVGNRVLTPSDSTLLREPVTIVATGNLSLSGPLSFEPSTLFVAGDTLFVEAGVSGQGGGFVGEKAIDITDAALLTGYFFSRQRLDVRGQTYLDYPSVLYVAGEAADEGGGIRIRDQAIVNGTLVHPPLVEPPIQHAGRIRIDEAATVRGLVFNGHETEVHGTVYGSILTHQFYFFVSPTNYINWLRDATVDVTERPAAMLVPLQFSVAPRLRVLQWEAYTESVQPSSES